MSGLSGETHGKLLDALKTTSDEDTYGVLFAKDKVQTQLDFSVKLNAVILQSVYIMKGDKYNAFGTYLDAGEFSSLLIEKLENGYVTCVPIKNPEYDMIDVVRYEYKSETDFSLTQINYRWDRETHDGYVSLMSFFNGNQNYLSFNVEFNGTMDNPSVRMASAEWFQGGALIALYDPIGAGSLAKGGECLKILGEKFSYNAVTSSMDSYQKDTIDLKQEVFDKCAEQWGLNGNGSNPEFRVQKDVLKAYNGTGKVLTVPAGIKYIDVRLTAYSEDKTDNAVEEIVFGSGVTGFSQDMFTAPGSSIKVQSLPITETELKTGGMRRFSEFCRSFANLKKFTVAENNPVFFADQFGRLCLKSTGQILIYPPSGVYDSLKVYGNYVEKDQEGNVITGYVPYFTVTSECAKAIKTVEWDGKPIVISMPQKEREEYDQWIRDQQEKKGDGTDPWFNFIVERFIVSDGVIDLSEATSGMEMFGGRFRYFNSIDLPSSLQKFNCRFDGINANRVNFPADSHLTEIGEDAFGSVFSDFTCENGVMVFGGNLTSFTVPGSVTKIGAGAFGASFDVVRIGSQVTHVGDRAFWNANIIIVEKEEPENGAPAGWANNWAGGNIEIVWMSGNRHLADGYLFEDLPDGTAALIKYIDRIGGIDTANKQIRLPDSVNGKPVTVIRGPESGKPSQLFSGRFFTAYFGETAEDYKKQLDYTLILPKDLMTIEPNAFTEQWRLLVEEIVFPQTLTGLDYWNFGYGYGKYTVLPSGIGLNYSGVLDRIYLHAAPDPSGYQNPGQWESHCGSFWGVSESAVRSKTGVTAEGVRYEIVRETYAIITGYTGSNAAITLPDTIEGVPVIMIQSLKDRDDVTSLTCGQYLMWVDAGAVSLKNLAELTFNDKVEYLGDQAFYACKKLKEVTFSKYVNMEGHQVFDCADGDGVIYTSEDGGYFGFADAYAGYEVIQLQNRNVSIYYEPNSGTDLYVQKFWFDDFSAAVRNDLISKFADDAQLLTIEGFYFSENFEESCRIPEGYVFRDENSVYCNVVRDENYLWFDIVFELSTYTHVTQSFDLAQLTTWYLNKRYGSPTAGRAAEFFLSPEKTEESKITDAFVPSGVTTTLYVKNTVIFIDFNILYNGYQGYQNEHIYGKSFSVSEASAIISEKIAEQDMIEGFYRSPYYEEWTRISDVYTPDAERNYVDIYCKVVRNPEMIDYTINFKFPNAQHYSFLYFAKAFDSAAAIAKFASWERLNGAVYTIEAFYFSWDFTPETKVPEGYKPDNSNSSTIYCNIIYDPEMIHYDLTFELPDGQYYSFWYSAKVFDSAAAVAKFASCEQLNGVDYVLEGFYFSSNFAPETKVPEGYKPNYSNSSDIYCNIIYL